MYPSKKILFGHDHYFARSVKDGAVYSNGGLPASAWSRYLDIFDELTVLGRLAGGTLNQSFTGPISSREKVRFVLINGFSNLQSRVLGNPSEMAIVSDLVSRHDAVVARLGSQIGLRLIRESRKQGKPYAIELVGCPFDALWFRGGLKAKLYALHEFVAVRREIQRADLVLYVTSAYLQNRYPCSKGITTSCSNVEITQVSNDVYSRRVERLNSPRETFKIGLIGNLSTKYKGVDVAINALRCLIDQGFNVELQVVGGGDVSPFFQMAKKYDISAQVQFLGSFPTDEVSFWLDDIDLYIQPSLTEGLPRSLIEAINRGVPAIGSKVGGIPELLSGDYLVTPGNAGELAKKIAYMISSVAFRQESSTQGMRKAKNYHVSELKNKRKSFYSRLLVDI